MIADCGPEQRYVVAGHRNPGAPVARGAAARARDSATVRRGRGRSGLEVEAHRDQVAGLAEAPVALGGLAEAEPGVHLAGRGVEIPHVHDERGALVLTGTVDAGAGELGADAPAAGGRGDREHAELGLTRAGELGERGAVQR